METWWTASKQGWQRRIEMGRRGWRRRGVIVITLWI
jgi:hypothetical protein